MRFSIIIPCHNAARTLEACLSCATAQAYTDYEVIVVDDASTDATSQIAGRFDVTVVLLPRQVGAGGARNTGALRATGDVLFFVDADVTFAEDSLEILRRAFAENPACAAVAGIPDKIPLERGAFQDFAALRYNYQFTRTSVECTSVPSWFLAMRREMFDDVGGFSEAFKGAGGEEFDFGYRMAEKGYSIRLKKTLLFKHRFPRMWPKLKTYYRRSVLFAGILRRRKRFQSSVLTCTEFCRTGIALAVPVVCVLARSLTVAAACLVIWFVLNVRFWDFVRRERGVRFAFASVGMDYLVFISMAAGGLVGFVRSLFGSETEHDEPIA